MEIKLIDFKRPIEASMNIIDRNQEPKSKDFMATLDSVNKNNDSLKKPVSKTDKKETTASKEEVEEMEEESTKKDESPVFEGMINLLNIIPEIQQQDEEVVEDQSTDYSLEQVDIIPESDIVINEYNFVNDEDTLKIIDELADEPIMLDEENNLEQDSIKLDSRKLDSAKVELKDVNKEDNKEIQSELRPVVTPIQSEKLEKVEDAKLAGESNPINSQQTIVEEDVNEFGKSSQDNEGKSEKQYELVKSSDSDEDTKIGNESFVTFAKDGVRFSADKPVEEPTIVNPKEVVEQIVEKVKFDLSENKNEIKLSLKPEALGEMTMNIEVAKDGIIAKIMVDNYRAKEIIEGNIVQLKEGIEDTAMEIKTFEVFVGNGADFDKHSSGQFNLKQNSKKMRIKNEDNKTIENYGEQIMDDRMNSINPYSESSLNLFA